MEKLCKRYRTKIQRLCSLPLPRLINNSTAASPSSWVHFKSMGSMEKGPNKPHTDTTTASNPNTPTNNLNFPDNDDLRNLLLMKRKGSILYHNECAEGKVAFRHSNIGLEPESQSFVFIDDRISDGYKLPSQKLKEYEN
ncbi:hypothetical protein V8G54_001453 [Vigna mungo]|uniref:Uncharacterized protein n=1 Tax=Vigna mungo TaxID=3915 RepID=A0AAQ3SBU6_VIGMU